MHYENVAWALAVAVFGEADVFLLKKLADRIGTPHAVPYSYSDH